MPQSKQRGAVRSWHRASQVGRACGRATRVSRPDADLWRATPTTSSYFVCGLLHQVRTPLALGKDAPLGRVVQRSGVIVAIPILSGLHHHYVRI